VTVQQIVALLYADACHQEVARLILYECVYYSVLRPKLQELAKRFGEDKVRTAERHLLQQTPSPGSNYLVQLRRDLWVQARQLLGPMPSELADWNKGLPESQHRKAPDLPKPPSLSLPQTVVALGGVCRERGSGVLRERAHLGAVPRGDGRRAVVHSRRDVARPPPATDGGETVTMSAPKAFTSRRTATVTQPRDSSNGGPTVRNDGAA
jgi:hypothetical protein